MALGADGVQIGTLFAASAESSAHENFKKAIVQAGDGDTFLSLKKIAPTRMLKNAYWKQLNEAEQKGVSKEELIELVGCSRTRWGIFDGDLIEGELEMGQVSALVKQTRPVRQIIHTLLSEFEQATLKMTDYQRSFHLK